MVLRELIGNLAGLFGKTPAQTRRFKKISAGESNLPDPCLIFCDTDVTLTVVDYGDNVEAGVLFSKGTYPFQFKKITSISGGNVYILY
jgi:hypothetical protein